MDGRRLRGSRGAERVFKMREGWRSVRRRGYRGTVPGSLCRSWPPRHSGDRRSEARAAPDRDHRAGACGAHRAEARTPRPISMPSSSCPRARRCCRARYPCSATAARSSDTGQLPLLSPAEEHELGLRRRRPGQGAPCPARGEAAARPASSRSSRTDSRSYRLTVKSMHERAIALTVFDQIPVSENQEIKVDLTF